MASIGGYRSPVDLGLGRVPTLTEPEAFNELTQVYNAIHLLNEYLDNLRNEAIGGGSGQTPAESMIFNRFFVAKALVAMPAGCPVSPCPLAGQNGVIPGALARNHTASTTTSNFCGVTLSSAEVGEDIRVGVGPAALQVPGLTAGTLLYAYSNLATNGNIFGDQGLYIGNPGAKSNAAGTAYAMPVALGITPGYAMFGQLLLP